MRIPKKLRKSSTERSTNQTRKNGSFLAILIGLIAHAVFLALTRA